MEKIINKIKKNKSLVGVALVLLAILVVFLANMSFADLLDNDVEVQANTELIYYLNVNYDGVDRNGDVSDDGESVQAVKVSSGEMIVEDRIPDGLTFNGFVATENGTIGAANRSDNTQCLGKVVDDTNEPTNQGVWNAGNTEYTYHGLHYDVASRTVSFKVENLQAGCYLTVGIKTTTPSTIDDPDTTGTVEQRRDFYNFATAREKSLTVNSNTVHAYMGKSNVALYKVTYEYSGNAPSNAPTAPGETNYAVASKVGVAKDVEIEGYTFSGWTTSDVTVTNGTFSMPEGNVTFTGSFTENTKHNVTYSITGTAPTNYVVPSQKQYYEGEKVSVDLLKENDIIDGYRFLGWTSNDVTIDSKGRFDMPTSNVSIVGSFEEVTYTLSYAFYENDALPANASSYLPASASYKEGTEVTLSPVLNQPNDYEFLGWYEDNPFVMPAHDVTVLGEWRSIGGTFTPTIDQTIVEAEDYYVAGDVVTIQITVTNTEDYPITDVLVSLSNAGVNFSESENYTLLSDNIAKIASIPANGTATLTATYTVMPKGSSSVTNVVEINGATAENNHELDPENTPSDSISFNTYTYGLKIYLKDRDDNTKSLEAADYNICTADDDDTTCFATITTDFNGYGVYDGLQGITYYLKQAKVTSGYVLDNTIRTLDMVNDADQNGYVTLNLENREMGSLPFTGGVGTIIYTIIGLIIIVGGFIFFIKYTKSKKKTKEQDDKKKSKTPDKKKKINKKNK